VKVPFSRHDNVLLVGEGDFSFALSLQQHHKVGRVTATCYDAEHILRDKYPQVRETIAKLQASDEASTNLPTQQGLADGNVKANGDEVSWEGFSPAPSSSSEVEDDSTERTTGEQSIAAILYGIDATKLSSTHKKVLRPYSPFTKIIFNFPHVGGLSTDVNRQVRYNQELLVGFFNSAKPLLSSSNRPAKLPELNRDGDEDEDFKDISGDTEPRVAAAVKGQILVTLFEGEPYTLWNIRDLARHCGLKVVESFKFPWSVYPGYQHARTIGDIESGKDRSDQGKRKGAWRGEERDARCYVLEDINDDPTPWRPSTRKRMRKDEDSDSE